MDRERLLGHVPSGVRRVADGRQTLRHLPSFQHPHRRSVAPVLVGVVVVAVTFLPACGFTESDPGEEGSAPVPSTVATPGTSTDGSSDALRWPRGELTEFSMPIVSTLNGSPSGYRVTLPNGRELIIVLPDELNPLDAEVSAQFSIEYTIGDEPSQQTFHIARGPETAWFKPDELVRRIGFGSRQFTEYRRTSTPAGLFLVETVDDWLVWRFESKDPLSEYPPGPVAASEVEIWLRSLRLEVDEDGYVTVGIDPPVGVDPPITLVDEVTGIPPHVYLMAPDWMISLSATACPEDGDGVHSDGVSTGMATVCDTGLGIVAGIQTQDGTLDVLEIAKAVRFLEA